MTKATISRNTHRRCALRLIYFLRALYDQILRSPSRHGECPLTPGIQGGYNEDVIEATRLTVQKEGA